METEEEYPFLATHTEVFLSDIAAAFGCKMPLTFQDPTCHI